MSYSYKITKTSHYYGYPQAEYHYKIDSPYFSGTVKFYGNQGFDYPQISHRHNNNGYFWSMHKFMEALFNGKLKRQFLDLKENESIIVTLDN